jgi:hypothetical protein
MSPAEGWRSFGVTQRAAAQERRRRESARQAPRATTPNAQGVDVPAGPLMEQPLFELLVSGAVAVPLSDVPLADVPLAPAPLETVPPLVAPVPEVLPAPLEAVVPASGGRVNVQ